jgi:hypothetical protein
MARNGTRFGSVTEAVLVGNDAMVDLKTLDVLAASKGCRIVERYDYYWIVSIDGHLPLVDDARQSFHFTAEQAWDFLSAMGRLTPQVEAFDAPAPIFPTLGPAETNQEHFLTKEHILAALDKPRSTYAVSIIASPGGKVEEIHAVLLQMRDEGLVKFNINNGKWSRAPEKAAG